MRPVVVQFAIRLHLEFPELVAAAELSVCLSLLPSFTNNRNVPSVGWTPYRCRSRMWYVDSRF